MMEVKTNRHHELYEALGSIVGEKYVTDKDFALIPYSRDISAFAASVPGIVVRPGSTEEVAEIVKLANRTNYPITLRGGGQSGGGVTRGEPTRHIVLDMGRLDKVKVDVPNRKVIFGAGIRPSMLDDALRPYGYYVDSVIGPYFTASMGGIISGIAGGGFSKNVSLHGCNWTQILGLKVVLPTGDIITTAGGPDTNVFRSEMNFREVTSPDLTGLFIASGGALGIITEIAMLIHPIPKYMKAVSYVAPDMESAWAIQLELSEGVTIPYTNIFMFEMTNLLVQAMSAGVEGYGAIYISLDGDDEEELAVRLRQIDQVCTKHGAVRGTPAMDQFAAAGTTGTADFVHNICSNACPFMTWESVCPRSESLEYTKGLVKIFKDFPGHEKYGAAAGLYTIPLSNVMITGITLKWNSTIPGADEHMRAVWKKGAEYMQKRGVTNAYAQGENSRYLSTAWSPIYSKVMSGIKKTLDPNGILCPGLWNF